MTNTTSTPEESKEQPAKNDGDGLSQNGDYSSLFIRDTKDCYLLSETEFANTIDVPQAQLHKQDNNFACTYILTDNGGNETRFQFIVTPMKSKEIKKEISEAKENMKTLGSDSRLTHLQVSETGDTYLSMNQDRHIMILNENYDGSVVVSYTPKFKPAENDLEFIKAQKDKARNQSYKLANYLLKKYKK